MEMIIILDAIRQSQTEKVSFACSVFPPPSPPPRKNHPGKDEAREPSASSKNSTRRKIPCAISGAAAAPGLRSPSGKLPQKEDPVLHYWNEATPSMAINGVVTCLLLARSTEDIQL